MPKKIAITSLVLVVLTLGGLAWFGPHRQPKPGSPYAITNPQRIKQPHGGDDEAFIAINSNGRRVIAEINRQVPVVTTGHWVADPMQPW